MILCIEEYRGVVYVMERWGKESILTLEVFPYRVESKRLNVDELRAHAISKINEYGARTGNTTRNVL